MYSDEDEEEKTEQQSDSFIKNFYYNNKVLIWIFCGIILFILIMSLLTKGGSVNSDSGDIVIYPEEAITISIGSSANVIAQVKNNPNAMIIWTVENDTIAKVDNGNVIGLGYGKTYVIASYIDSKNEKHTAEREIIVADGDPSISLTDVSFKEGDLFMPLNSTYKIALIPSPSRGYIASADYTSSNTGIVTVDNTGLVTAVGEGEATISVNVNNGAFRQNLRVYVNRDYTRSEIILTPEKIPLDGELRKVKVGTTEKLTYTVVPSESDKTKLIWESSDTSILTVDENGNVTGIKEGTAIVTVSSVNGKKDRIDIEVESDIVDVTNIDLSVDNINLTVGQSMTITPIVTPDNASNKALSYMSLDSNIASVYGNDTGTQATITAVRKGSTTIVIRSTNGIEKRLTVTVTGNGSGSGGSSSGGDATIVVKSNSNNLSKYYDEVLKMYAKGPSIVTISIHDGLSKIKYCLVPYNGVDCTPSKEIVRSGVGTTSQDITVYDGNIYLLCIKKYDNDGNEVGSSSPNYSNSLLHYYINTRGNGGTIVNTPTPVGGTLYTINGKVYDNQANANNNPYYGSGTISFSVNSSVGYILVCSTKSGTTCTPSKKITSVDGITINQTGSWIINIREVYNNGTTKDTTKYVYVQSSRSNPTTSIAPVTKECNVGEYLDGSICKTCPKCNGTVTCFTSKKGSTSSSDCYGTVPAGKYIECNTSGCTVSNCPSNTYSNDTDVNYRSNLKTTCVSNTNITSQLTIKCNKTTAVVGEQVSCEVKNLSPGDSILKWYRDGNERTNMAGWKTFNTSRSTAGSHTYKVVTKQGAQAYIKIEWKDSNVSTPTPPPTAQQSNPKQLSSLNISCNGSTLVIKDGNTTLSNSQYCGSPISKRGNISMLYTYTCKGDGVNYQGTITKTCPDNEYATPEPTPTTKTTNPTSGPKQLSSLNISCNGSTLVMKDGNTTLSNSQYCGSPISKRGNISMLYTYTCKGDGVNYQGTITKTCPDENASTTPTTKPTATSLSPICSSPCCVNGTTVYDSSACSSTTVAGRTCGACKKTPTPSPIPNYEVSCDQYGHPNMKDSSCVYCNDTYSSYTELTKGAKEKAKTGKYTQYNGCIKKSSGKCDVYKCTVTTS